MRIFLLALLLLVLGFAAYVRLAPSDPARWHRFAAPKAPGDYQSPGGFEARRVVVDDSVLAQLDAIIRATPRTRVLAGSVEEGFITYMTRSALWGFPDYTNVYLTPNDQLAGGRTTLTIRGHLRFGRSDLGVNRARIEGWMAQLPPGALQSLPE